MKKFTSTRLVSHTIALFGAPMFCLALLVAVCTTGLQAQTAPQISVQGTLKTASGTPAPDGTQTVTFRLYNVETGGTALWEETADVEIVGGIYSHYLGSATPLNAANFASTLYLAVKVGSYELTPRNRLAYAPYAFAVNTAQTVVCSGAVGDIKYSILNPTEFEAENGACWVPMDGRALATTDKLRIRTGMTTVPNGGGFFLRAQEFSNTDQDPDRTYTSSIAQGQGDTFRSHNHTGTTNNDGSHEHTVTKTRGFDGGGFVGIVETPDGLQRSITIPSSGAHTHSFTTNASGSPETRPKNLNFWIYIRIN